MFVHGANGAVGGYNLKRSLRFRASASAYLNRTLVASNRNKWTFNQIFKRGSLNSISALFSSGSSNSNYTEIRFNADNTFTYISFDTATTYINLTTSQVFRDIASWYHICISYDDAQATASNRLKIYINESQVTAFSTATYPPQNYQDFINGAFSHTIGRFGPSAGDYFDGYLAEVNFIDGQALTPASFGETNALTGVWQPKAYTGTYGTNGFYLDFETTTSVSALGNDKSGNGNTWTVNNVSLTAGVTYDSMTDVPTLTSATAANYCVLNPLAGVSGVLLSGNLNFAPSSTAGNKQGTIGVSSGKWYWEIRIASLTDYQTHGVTTNASYATGFNENYAYGSDGRKWIAGSNSSYGASYANTDTIAFALDMDAGTLTAYKNNVSQGILATGLIGTVFPICRTDGTGSIDANFGQRPFAFSPPTGFVALNTFNLPTATILDGSKQMDAGLYTGDGTLSRTLTGLYEFQPDFIWAKNRSGAFAHVLQDSVRGFSSTRKLSSNTTDPENSSGNATDPGFGYISGVSSTGFSVASTGGGITHLNQDTAPYVGWAWKANGAGSSNTNGSITSTVSVNATAGFSVVTYTGNGSNSQTVGHGLGVAPSMVIVKGRSNAEQWWTWHSSLTNGSYALILNATNAQTSYSNIFNIAPNSSIFNLQNGGGVNGSGQTFVAYCFAEIDGFSKFGSYTGNGSTDGTMVYLGFRPKFVLVKCSSSDLSGQAHWVVQDASRSPYNAADATLYPNLANSEGTSGEQIDFLSNGFKIRNTVPRWNSSGATFIYAAFAENPFKNSLAR